MELKIEVLKRWKAILNERFDKSANLPTVSFGYFIGMLDILEEIIKHMEKTNGTHDKS